MFGFLVENHKKCAWPCVKMQCFGVRRSGGNTDCVTVFYNVAPYHAAMLLGIMLHVALHRVSMLLCIMLHTKNTY